MSLQEVEERSRQLYPKDADPRERRMQISGAYLSEVEAGQFVPPTHKLRVLAEIYGEALEPLMELAGKRRDGIGERPTAHRTDSPEGPAWEEVKTQSAKRAGEHPLDRATPVSPQRAQLRRPPWRPRDTAETNERKNLHLATILILAVVVYLNALSGQFVFGDRAAVVENPAVHQITNAPMVFGFAGGRPAEAPVPEVSYMLDYALGGDHPLVYHLSSIVYHAAAALLVYLIIERLLHSGVAAFFAGALFAVHPLNTEAVAYVSGRRELLFGLFYLLAFHAYLRHRALGKRWQLIASRAMFVLALFTSPLALTFPVLVACADAVRSLRFQGENRYAPLGREIRRVTKNLMRERGWIYFFFVVLAALVGGYQLAVPGRWFQGGFYGGSLMSHLWTLARVVLHYLRLLVYPVGLNADYSFNAFPVSASVPEWFALAGVVTVAALCYGAIRALRRYKYYSFSIVWLLLLLILAAQWTPRQELVVERLAYLPCFGFCLAIGLLLSQGMRTVRHTRLMYGLFAILLVWYGVGTVARNADWRDPFSLWRATVRTAPASGRAHNNLGTAYLGLSMPNQALAEFQRALTIEPQRAEFHFNLALAHEHKGMIEEALAAYRRVLDLQPQFRNVQNNMGLLYLRQGKLKQAVTALQEEIALNPGAAEAHHSLGVIYGQQGRRDLAIQEFRAAIQARPTYAQAHANLAHLYSKEGNLEAAIKEYERALQLTPDMAAVHSALGDVLVRMGKVDRAMSQYKKALEIDDSLAETHNNLGILYGKKRQLEEAIEQYERALELRPDHINVRLNLGATYELQGQPELAIAHYVKILEKTPGSVMVYAFLGRAYATTGKKEEAIRSYTAFLDKWKGDPKYTEIIKRNIEKLQEAEDLETR